MTKVLNYSGDWYARVIAEDVCRLKEQLNLSLKEAFDYFMKKPVHDFDTLYKTLVMITHGVTFTIDTDALIQWCKDNPIKYKYCHQLWFRLKQELNSR